MDPSKDVHLRIDTSTVRRTVSTENSEAIVRAVLEALHVPVSAAIKEVVISTARTAQETYTELAVLHQSAKVERRVKLSYVTAQQVNAHLVQLEYDGFDPVVTRQLRERLIKILTNELERQP